MDENKPQMATWVLCVGIDPDNQESPPRTHLQTRHAAGRWPDQRQTARRQTPRMHRACRPNRMPGLRRCAQKAHRTCRRRRRGNARRPPHRPDGRHSGRQVMTDLLTPAELAVMLGMSVRTLANWRSTGKGPPYLKIGVEPPEGHQDRRKVRYQRQVAEKWALAHRYRRTVAR